MEKYLKLTILLIIACIAIIPHEVISHTADRISKPIWPTRPTKTPRTTTTTTPSPTTRPPPDVIQTEGCGGVLEGQRGLIEFKYGKQIASNEICVWTIRAPGAGHIHIDLVDEGFSQDGSGSYITFFTVGDEAVLQPGPKIVSGDTPNFAIRGQVGYVIFRSGAKTGLGSTGFSLYFEGDSVAIDASEWTGNKSHVHLHLNRAEGHEEEFSYPPPNDEGFRGQYQPNQFGSWVVNPEQTKMINTLYLYYIDFEDFSCADFINIHQIDGDSPKLLERKCNTNTYFSGSFNYKTVREPFIITLTSDDKNERSGFILYYENDRY